MCITTAAILLIAAVMICAFSEKPVVRRYTVVSDRIQNEITLVQISDLHETNYGEGQSDLIQMIESIDPDVVVMTGDMADGYRDDAPLKQLVEPLVADFPCYYVSGNHEAWAGIVEDYIAYYADAGVRVLSGSGDRITVGTSELDIFGVDDPDHCGEEAWQAQLSACREQADNNVFSVLLTHRPERINEYTGFDLTFAGHAHGGQVRIPGIVNGLFAPDQGWFPAYAGGIYSIGSGTMIVSRGLEINSLPRIFNRPEIVAVTIVPA